LKVGHDAATGRFLRCFQGTRSHQIYGEGDIQVQALRGIDLELRSGEMVVLLGPSGSGKSTLVKMFSVRLEGDQVTLRSTTAQRGSGDTITFIFSGAVSGDTISGPLYMGEYLNAKFTAKRYSYPAARAPILVPNGPPLAN
jgi:energy-coupling factor transporter ATP-binding protein EcfA2